MSIELMKRALEFITGVYFGEHEGSRADREKLEADLTTAIQQAEAQQPTAQDEQEANGLPPIVAGAIFDFAGFMTTRSEVIEVGSTAEAGPVADLVKEWAESRDLELADAAVLSWQLHITRASLPATPEPVYWEWRHLSTHPDTVDFGKWSEWKRVEARSAIHTIEDALAEFRAYIAQGCKYELRALYDHPAPSAPATSEPVKAAPYNPTEEMRWAMKRIDPALSSEQCRALWSAAWSVAPSTHPAPSVPGDVVRDAISTVREHYRGTDWGKAAESICDAIDAMLAAKEKL